MCAVSGWFGKNVNEYNGNAWKTGPSWEVLNIISEDPSWVFFM